MTIDKQSNDRGVEGESLSNKVRLQTGRGKYLAGQDDVTVTVERGAGGVGRRRGLL